VPAASRSRLIQVICPTSESPSRTKTCPEVAAKIFRFGFTPNQQLCLVISPRRRGVRVVTNVEAGCDPNFGRGCDGGRLTRARTAKPCGAGAPTRALSSQRSNEPASDGSKKARSRGRARSKPSKPTAQGRPVSSAEPVVLPRAFLLHADHGHQPVPGLPCALSFREDKGTPITRTHRAARTKIHVSCLSRQ
jgi:hypothetical protein